VRLGIQLACVLFVLACAAHAAAEPGQPSPPKRSRFHAGFGAGPGLLVAHSGVASDTRSFSGGSVSFAVLMGGRIGRHFVLGGAYLRDQIFSLSSKDERVDGDEPDLSGISFAYSAIGVLGEVYFMERGGPRLELFVGQGFLDVRGRSSSRVDDPSGALLSAGAGYDFAVSPDVSLGVLLRVNSAQFEVRESNGTDVDSLIPALLFTATLN
jgi:hypothetical protein